MTGFGAVPDELQQAAKAIGNTVQQTAGLLWQGPSGNYGHPGVQEGWGQFVEDAKSEIHKLAETAKGHGESLAQSALHYLETDEHVAGLLGKAIGDVGGAIGGAVGGAARAVGSAVGEAGGAVGGAVGGAARAVGSAVGEAGGAVGGAVGAAGAAATGGMRMSGSIMDGFGGGISGPRLAKEAEF